MRGIIAIIQEKNNRRFKSGFDRRVSDVDRESSVKTYFEIFCQYLTKL